MVYFLEKIKNGSGEFNARSNQEALGEMSRRLGIKGKLTQESFEETEGVALYRLPERTKIYPSAE